jgi:uncharacterized protein
MNETAAVTVPQGAAATARRSIATWIGLFLSLFGMLIVRQAIRVAFPAGGTGATALREGLHLGLAAVLLLLVTLGEKQPLTSIGLGTSRWWKSLAWGLVTAVICAAFALILIRLTGYGKGPSPLDRLPLWLVTAITFRAGIVEELCYRGYAIERLQAVGLSRPAAAIIPLAIFSVGHWTGGAANILIAAALGGVLTLFYLARRDLVANMFAHTLVDFVANVVPRLLA